MNKYELARQTAEALDVYSSLPPEEQMKRLIACGTINDKGEVLMGLECLDKEGSMPFQSKQQSKACFATKGFGKKIDCKEYAKHTNYKKLPKKVKK